jgi:hypothetical protein
MVGLGVGELWKVFEWCAGRSVERNKENRERAEGWLDEVQKVLSELSEAWVEICSADLRVDGQSSRAAVWLSAVRGSPQLPIAYRLMEFYRATSKVIPGTEGFQPEFLTLLANVLQKRDAARHKLDQASSTEDEAEMQRTLAEMRTLSDELQRQVAMLQVAIATFKAAPVR